jgi:hypothetical protein
MTYDSSTSSSIRFVESPIHVLTVDGTPLLVVSRGTLSTSSFHVPSVAHVSQLTMQLFSSGQIVDSSCSVNLDFDSCSVQDSCTAWCCPRRRDGLWELDWLRLPSAATMSSLSALVVASIRSFQ